MQLEGRGSRNPRPFITCICLGCLVLAGIPTAWAEPSGVLVSWGAQKANVRLGGPIISVAAGFGNSMALRADGSVAAWGGNRFRESDVPSPNTDFIAVTGGTGHSLGLKSDGSVVAWGWNQYGQRNVPSPNSDFVALAGGTHSLGLKSDGSITAWGFNNQGQCDVPSPNTGFTAIDAGSQHS